ncbi:MAG: hypothetical protein P8Y54_09935 [Xanthomonadales bacterium]
MSLPSRIHMPRGPPMIACPVISLSRKARACCSAAGATHSPTIITGAVSTSVPVSAATASRLRDTPEVRNATSSLAAASPPTPTRAPSSAETGNTW